ncbi:MAG: CARDB domain-containing protein, partial [Pseudomonadota bacterium]
TIEIKTGKFETFDQNLADMQPMLLPIGTRVLPFGQRVPQGWLGGMRRDGFSSFSSQKRPSRINPGSSLAGLELISSGVPTFRAMEIEPDWQFISDEEATEEEEQIFAEIEKSILFHTQTLGPSGVFPGTYDHWNQLRDDLNKAIQLGWAPDQAFAATLVNQLASARQAVDAGDGTLAKQRLQTLLTTLAQSTSSQRRQEVRDLVYWNAQALIASTPDTPIPFEPKVTLTPPAQKLPLGATYTLTATVINAATGKPIPDFSLPFAVIDGPHAGLRMRKVTDAAGKASFSYTGTSLGRDRIWLGEDGEVRTEFGQAGVTWEGGPDLVIELFIPPLLKAKGGAPVTVTEITANKGSTAAASSVTRYYLSLDELIDPRQDRPIAERRVGLLAPGQSSEKSRFQFTLPFDLTEGTYHLGACADADGAVAELDETNNCQVNQIVMALEPGPVENLRARAKEGKVALVWTPVEGAAGYNIYRGTTAGGPYQLIKAGHVTSYATYEDSGLTNGVTYYYVVRWLRERGLESPPSAEASATPVAGPLRR